MNFQPNDPDIITWLEDDNAHYWVWREGHCKAIRDIRIGHAPFGEIKEDGGTGGRWVWSYVIPGTYVTRDMIKTVVEDRTHP